VYTGAGIWAVRHKRLGRPRYVTIGDVRVLDRLDRVDEKTGKVVQGAVEAARNVLAKIQLQILDPQVAKREAIRAVKRTFISLVPSFLNSKVENKENRPRTLKQSRRFLTGYYFKPLHKLPVDEITSDKIQPLIDEIKKRSGNDTAAGCYSRMKVFFDWMIKYRLPEGHLNPMARVEEPVRSPPRERVLSDDEIHLIWQTCEAWEAEVLADNEFYKRTGRRRSAGETSITDYPRGARLLFLTGCRAQEIGDLQWSEVDLDNGELFLPKERTKNEIDLCIPLSDMAIQILRKVEDERGRSRPNVFGLKSGGHKRIEPACGCDGQNLDGVHFKIIRRISRSNPEYGRRYATMASINPLTEKKIRNLLAIGASSQRIRREINVSHYTVQAIKFRMEAGPDAQAPGPDAQGPEPWRTHDIRRTFKTKMQELGVPDGISERLMGHVGHLSEIERTYGRHEYWEQKREAVMNWEERLARIIAGTAPKIAKSKFGRKTA
jgi:integrase